MKDETCTRDGLRLWRLWWPRREMACAYGRLWWHGREIVCAYGIYGRLQVKSACTYDIYGGTKPVAQTQIDAEPLGLWHRSLSEPRTTNNSPGPKTARDCHLLPTESLQATYPAESAQSSRQIALVAHITGRGTVVAGGFCVVRSWPTGSCLQISARRLGI
jgi:hypothetical protein